MRRLTKLTMAADGEPTDLARIIRAKGLQKLGQIPISEAGEACGLSTRAMNVAKAAVAPGTTGGWGEAAVDAHLVVAEFLTQARNSSAFIRMLDGAIRPGFRQRVGLVNLGASAWARGEGKPIPLSSLGLDATNLEPETVTSLLVLTRELLDSTQSAAIINRELRRAVTSEIDAEFFTAVFDGDSPSIASTGNDFEAASLDLLALLEAVSPTAESYLVFAASPDVGRRAAALPTTAGGFAFPEMGVSGGSMLNIPTVVTDGVPAGTLTLIDASNILAEMGEINFSMSQQAAIEMQDDQTITQDAPTGAALVSLWQVNSVAVKIVADWAAKRHPEHDNAVARLTGIAWGGTIPAS